MNKHMKYVGLPFALGLSYLYVFTTPALWPAFIAAIPLLGIKSRRSWIAGFVIGFVGMIFLYVFYPFGALDQLDRIMAHLTKLPTPLPLLLYPLFYGVIFAVSAIFWSGLWELIRPIVYKSEPQKSDVGKTNISRMGDELRIVPALLLLISCFTHVSQIFIYGANLPTIVVALFGVAYIIIATLMLKGYYYSAIAASTVPALGAALGIYRFLTIIPNPFSVFDPLLDAFIVPLSFFIFLRWKKWRYAEKKIFVSQHP